MAPRRPRRHVPQQGIGTATEGGCMDSSTSLKEMADKVGKLQRAVYFLIWKRTGFGEQCLHCGHSYPGHAERCKAAEIEELVR
jgi:hypothetical protein